MIDWGQVMLFRDNPFNISQKYTLMFKSFNFYSREQKIINARG